MKGDGVEVGEMQLGGGEERGEGGRGVEVAKGDA